MAMNHTYVGIAVAACLVGTHWIAYQHGRTVERGESVKVIEGEYQRRDALTRELAQRDADLAETQARAAEKRNEVITKQEIVYRDRIKTITVRDCVSNSGLFQLYNSTLGVDADHR